jgi:hypothetical protein
MSRTELQSCCAKAQRFGAGRATDSPRRSQTILTKILSSTEETLLVGPCLRGGPVTSRTFKRTPRGHLSKVHGLHGLRTATPFSVYRCCGRGSRFYLKLLLKRLSKRREANHIPDNTIQDFSSSASIWSISFASPQARSRPAAPLRPNLALGSLRGALNI